MREMCPYSEFFWSVFIRIRTEYGEILSISPYSVRMWENTDTFEYGHLPTKSNTSPWVFLMFLKLYRWWQITKSVIYFCAILF